MLNFLRRARKFVNAKETICVVLGNESCDLDSCTSALCLAYLLEQEHHKKTLPVLNIPRRDYTLKTEVVYLMQKYNISEEMLTFRDELHDDFLKRSEFVLVDHHVSPFVAKSIAVYDHRPRDESVTFPSDCLVNIDLVGSCATLVADKWTTADNIDVENDFVALNLLRDTIVLDTVNFSPSASRYIKKDVIICCKLECLLRKKPNYEDRDEIFRQLCKARADISALTASQLLRKDLKIVQNPNMDYKIALPGFPLQVQQLIQKPNAESALKDFAIETGCNLVLLIGMFVKEGDGVERDIGLVSTDGKVELRNSIEAKLLASQDPPLNLELYSNCYFMDGRFYKQNNLKATRKHIVPIVSQVLENWPAK